MRQKLQGKNGMADMHEITGRTGMAGRTNSGFAPLRAAAGRRGAGRSWRIVGAGLVAATGLGVALGSSVRPAVADEPRPRGDRGAERGDPPRRDAPRPPEDEMNRRLERIATGLERLLDRFAAPDGPQREGGPRPPWGPPRFDGPAGPEGPPPPPQAGPPRPEGPPPPPPAGPPRPEGAAGLPAEVRERMERALREGRERMQDGIRRLEEAKERFENLERRVRELEQEVARLKEKPQG